VPRAGDHRGVMLARRHGLQLRTRRIYVAAAAMQKADEMKPELK